MRRNPKLECPYCPRTFERGRQLHAHLMNDMRDHDLDYPDFVPTDAEVSKLVSRSRARAEAAERESLEYASRRRAQPQQPQQPEISYTKLYEMQQAAEKARQDEQRAQQEALYAIQAAQQKIDTSAAAKKQAAVLGAGVVAFLVWKFVKSGR